MMKRRDWLLQIGEGRYPFSRKLKNILSIIGNFCAKFQMMPVIKR